MHVILSWLLGSVIKGRYSQVGSLFEEDKHCSLSSKQKCKSSPFPVVIQKLPH